MSCVGLVREAPCVPDVSHCTFSTRRASVLARARHPQPVDQLLLAQLVVLTAACSETSPPRRGSA